MTAATTTRNANLDDLSRILREQQAAKLDVVATAGNFGVRDGLLVVKGMEAVIDESGVTPVDGIYRPTVVFDEGIASRLNIPVKYLRELRVSRPDIYDATVNGFLHGRKVRHADGTMEEKYPGDARKHLLRLFRGSAEQPGVARSMQSDSYRRIDHFDVLMAVLTGIRESGAQVQIQGADLTDRRMYVRIYSPQVATLAPELMNTYRWGGRDGRQYPTVFAGFVVENSETGNGKFRIVPRIVYEVCTNGQTFSADAVASVHLGEKLEAGVVQWSERTEAANLELITSKAKDAVTQFLSPGYLEGKVRELTEKSAVPVEQPADTIQTLGKALTYSDETINGVLNWFIQGGQGTAGGVMQAVTAYAQTVDDAELAAFLEDSAVQALTMAAKR